MSRNRSARKRSVTVCDPVKGLVSPNDVRSWLLATGWKYQEKSRYFDRDKNSIRDPRSDSSSGELERLISDLAYVTKRRPGDILRAIVAHARGGPAVDALPPSGDPVAELERLRPEVAAANIPLVTCAGCGFEWDGRSEPPSECPKPGPDEYDHGEMNAMWWAIEQSGLVRAADELPDEFIRRLSRWEMGR